MCLFLFSQVIYGPRRGPTFNNRWWNYRREWNLRISIREGEGVPKGGEQHPVLLLFAPFGDGRREFQLSAGSIPFGHSTSGYSHSPPSGTAVRMPYCFLPFPQPFSSFILPFFPNYYTPFIPLFRPFIPFPPFIIPLQSYFPKHLETLLLFLNFALLFKMESGSFGKQSAYLLINKIKKECV